MQLQLRAIFWAPPLVWTVLATAALAPAIGDMYDAANLTNIVWSRTEAPGAPRVPKLFPLLLAMHLVGPAIGCAAVLLGARWLLGERPISRSWRNMRGEGGSKAE